MVSRVIATRPANPVHIDWNVRWTEGPQVEDEWDELVELKRRPHLTMKMLDDELDAYMDESDDSDDEVSDVELKRRPHLTAEVLDAELDAYMKDAPDTEMSDSDMLVSELTSLLAKKTVSVEKLRQALALLVETA